MTESGPSDPGTGPASDAGPEMRREAWTGPAPLSIRGHHRTEALRALRRRRLSRAGLARELGVTRAAAARIVAGLMEDGCVVEGGVQGAHGDQGGRPGMALELSAAGPLAMGVEIGHDRLRVVVMDLKEAVVAEEVLAAPEGVAIGGGEFDAACDLALGLAGTALHAAGEPPGSARKRLAAITVAVPGFTDREGRIVSAPLLGWADVPLRGRFAQRFGVPVAVANDANLCVFGETYLLAAAGPDEPEAAPEVLFVLMETGVGGGYLIGGSFLAGADGLGCEVGHVGGRGTGRPGDGRPSLEGRFGKPHLVARAMERLGAPLDAAGLLSLVASGDPAALAFAEREGCALCEPLADLAYLLNPARIVFGGGMAALLAPALDAMAEHLDRALLPRFPRPGLAISRFGARAAVMGAAAHAHAAVLLAQGRRVQPASGA